MSFRIKILIWIFLTIIGITAWIWSFISNETRASIALLAASLFFIPLTSGLLSWSAIIEASYGSWPGKFGKFPLSAIGFSVPSILLLIALWILSPYWNPYTNELGEVWHRPWFSFSRDIALLSVFWIIGFFYVRRQMVTDARILAVWLILSYAISISLISFDLIMGLRTKWESALFGAYVFIGGLYAAVALWSIQASISGIFGKDRLKLNLARAGQYSYQDRLHDLGKLVFAFCMLTGYLLFCQLLPIWYENMPRETSFLIPLINYGPWKKVSIGLLITVFLGPILFLLPRKVKRTPLLLCCASGVILVGLWVERLWLILPSFGIQTLSISDIGAFVALGGFAASGSLFAEKYMKRN